MERRLAAILAADMVGYTRLMNSSEAETLQRLNELRTLFIEPVVGEHHGRIVKVMGDGFLVEFASVVDALSCAIAWQSGVAIREIAVEEDKRLVFRIGINLGDVIVEGGDIFGDGVNIAARLEALAHAGGICISEDAYRQVRRKIDAVFEDLGELDLKNVSEPVRVYRIGKQTEEVEQPPTRQSQSYPVRPSVAVLAFEELGDGTGQMDLCVGLAADITTELSRSGMISVVGRYGSQSRSLHGLSLQDIGRTLSVRYVLSGTVRRMGERGRITAELLEVDTGRQYWSERYDRRLDDVFTVQDEISRVIAGIVEPALHRAEIERIYRNPTKDLQPHELVLRAWSSSDQGYEEDNRSAQRDCEEAMLRAPTNSDAHSLLAWILYHSALSAWTDSPETTLRRALALSEHALLINPKDYDALGARGFSLIGLGRYDTAAWVLEELKRRFPDHDRATMYQAALLNSLDQHYKAAELIHHAIKINPDHDQWLWVNLGRILFCLERYPEAVSAFEQFKTLSKFPFGSVFLAASLAASGSMEEARAEAGSLSPNAGKLNAAATVLYRDGHDRQRLLTWGSLAGLPL